MTMEGLIVLNEQQRDEIEALRAIYPNEFTREDEGRPNIFEISISSVYDEPIELRVSLQIEYSPDYPSVVPHFHVVSHGTSMRDSLNDNESQLLHDLLEDLAHTLELGSPMVIELVQALTVPILILDRIKAADATPAFQFELFVGALAHEGLLSGKGMRYNNDSTCEWDPLLGSYLQNIPNEIMVHLLSFMDAPSIARLTCTCKYLRDSCADESLWKRLYKRKFWTHKSFSNYRRQFEIDWMRRYPYLVQWDPELPPATPPSPWKYKSKSVAVNPLREYKLARKEERRQEVLRLEREETTKHEKQQHQLAVKQSNKPSKPGKKKLNGRKYYDD